MSKETTGKRPTHTAYSVREYRLNGENKSDWTRVGVAWRHEDGEGFSIQLEAIPLSGRIQVRTNKAKPEQQPEEIAAE